MTALCGKVKLPTQLIAKLKFKQFYLRYGINISYTEFYIPSGSMRAPPASSTTSPEAAISQICIPYSIYASPQPLATFTIFIAADPNVLILKIEKQY
jgi:hypothetical protein